MSKIVLSLPRVYFRYFISSGFKQWLREMEKEKGQVRAAEKLEDPARARALEDVLESLTLQRGGRPQCLNGATAVVRI